MRPIEFRGKRLDNGEWAHGYISETFGITTIIYEDRDNYYCEEKVDPATVGQYTGLKDKNGNKIFEGDIVAPSGFVSEINKPGIVKWCDKKLCFYVDSIETSIYSAGYKMYFGFDNAIEIRGNIHENKELLEGCAEE